MAAREEVVSLRGEVQRVGEENVVLRDKLSTLEGAMLFVEKGAGEWGGRRQLKRGFCWPNLGVWRLVVCVCGVY